MYMDTDVTNFRYIEPDDIKQTACIMHSSGTTGMPKGVEISNYSLLRISEDKNIYMTNGVSLWFSSLYWLSGILKNLKAIEQGAKVILYPEFDEEMTCRLIEKYKVKVKHKISWWKFLVNDNIKLIIIACVARFISFIRFFFSLKS